LIVLKKVELSGCGINLNPYYHPLAQTTQLASVQRPSLSECSFKTFLQKAVDSLNEFDKLSAASTEKPLKQPAES